MRFYHQVEHFFMPKTVTVAIISDTHAVLHPEIKALITQCDIAIHAGDICDANILTSMKPKTGKVVAVAGNNDYAEAWPADQLDIVDALPQIAELNLPGGIIKVEHGHKHGMHSPDHETLRNAHSEARAIIYGHTHKKVIDDYKLPRVMNPGAAGEQRNRGGSSCLILTASEQRWSVESFRFLS